MPFLSASVQNLEKFRVRYINALAVVYDGISIGTKCCNCKGHGNPVIQITVDLCTCLLYTSYIRQTREYVSGQREYMRNIMKMMGYVVFASKANYLFFKGRPGLEKEALEAGFLIRDCQNYEGLSEGFYRIAVRTKEENERLITWLGRL